MVGSQLQRSRHEHPASEGPGSPPPHHASAGGAQAPLRLCLPQSEPQGPPHVDTRRHAPTFQPRNAPVTQSPLKSHPVGAEGRAPPRSRPAGSHGDGRAAGASAEGLRVPESVQARASAVRPGTALPAPAWVEPPRPFPGPGSPAPGNPPTRLSCFTDAALPSTRNRVPRTVRGGAICLRSLSAGGVRTTHLRPSPDKRVPWMEGEAHGDFRGLQRYPGARLPIPFADDTCMHRQHAHTFPRVSPARADLCARWGVCTCV